MAAVTTMWKELAPCLATLDAALGGDKDCMKTAYDGYGEQLAMLRAEAQRRVTRPQRHPRLRIRRVPSWRPLRRCCHSGTLSSPLTWDSDGMPFRTARRSSRPPWASQPCDARTAYILLRETQGIFQDVEEQAAKCLPEEMRNLIKEIDKLQMKARAAQTAKSQADAEATKASAAVDQAAADKSGVILELFAKCKQPPPASAPAAPASRPRQLAVRLQRDIQGRPPRAKCQVRRPRVGERDTIRATG